METAETQRQFFVIFSSRALDSIDDLIRTFYDKVRESHPKANLKEFCLSVPDKFKNQQTKRTFVVIDELVAEALKKAEDEIDEFTIQKLQMKKHFYPNTDRSEVPAFYIALPKNLSLSVCQTHLIDRMTALRSYGIWNKNDYNIYIPQSDRVGNKHSGTAFIYFNGFEESRLDDIVLSRLFVNNTKWQGTNLEVHCHWRQTKEGLAKRSEAAAAATTENESEYTSNDASNQESPKEDDNWVTKVKGSLKK